MREKEKRFTVGREGRGEVGGIFGEMCSYKVRNVNLNFGGGFLGLGG